MNTKKIILICLTVFSLASVTAMAQTELPVAFTWTAPTTGSAVEFYVVEHSVDGGPWNQIASTSTNSYTLNATVGQSHRIRVAGVDASDRQGPFSVASDPFTPDLGAPGAPGKPILF